MRYRLRSYDVSPPGNYCYEQTEGIRRQFGCHPLIEALARIVSDFRRGNNLPRADIKETLADVDEYNCTRLGNNPSFVVPADAANVVPLNTSSPIITPCKGCGVVLS